MIKAIIIFIAIVIVITLTLCIIFGKNEKHPIHVITGDSECQIGNVCFPPNIDIELSAKEFEQLQECTEQQQEAFWDYCKANGEIQCNQ